MRVKSKEKLVELLHKNKELVLSFRDVALDITLGRRNKYLEGNFDLYFEKNYLTIIYKDNTKVFI